jgi:hypothetical protein
MPRPLHGGGIITYKILFMHYINLKIFAFDISFVSEKEWDDKVLKRNSPFFYRMLIPAHAKTKPSPKRS